MLRIQCEIDPQYAYVRLRELAERGAEEARLYLEREPLDGVAVEADGWPVTEAASSTSWPR